MKKIWILIMVIGVMFSINIVNAENQCTRSASRETCCENGICHLTLFSGSRFAQNSTGHWVDPSEILYITKQSDDLTFHYSGIKGYANITFETGAIYNGNYYSMAEVKTMKPNIHFSFPSEKHSIYHKYAVNITNITENLNPDLIENITLTYKNHYGFTLDQLTQGNRWFYIKGTMALYFEDLLEKHPLRIVKSEKRIYIDNITDNIVNGNLYLDPTVMLQDADSENLEDTYIQEDDADNNQGDYSIAIVSGEGTSTDNAEWTYIKFNINSLPSGATIVDSDLCFFIYSNAYDTGETATSWIYELDNQTWVETDPTWNNKVVGAGALIDTNNTIDGDWVDFWLCFNSTSWVASEYGDGDSNVSFIWNSTLDYGTIDALYARPKEYTTDASERPYLNITYSGGVPLWYTNQSSLPTAYSPDTQTYEFNVTWNSSDSNINVTLIESNYSGTATNYTMINDTYGGDIYNYTIQYQPQVGTYYWKSYANDTDNDWNSTDKWEFTISTATPNIYSYEFNDSYITLNESTLLRVNASKGATVQAEIQTTGNTTNYTLSYQTSGNYTFTFNKTYLGLEPTNASIINVTKIFTNGNNYTMTTNTSSINVSYSTANIDVSHADEVESGNSITFTTKYNTTENTYITNNCTIYVAATTYDMTYSSGTHTKSVSTDGWSPHDYQYTVTCTNSSYQTKTKSGSFDVTGSTGGGGGNGGGGGSAPPKITIITTNESALIDFDVTWQFYEPGWDTPTYPGVKINWSLTITNRENFPWIPEFSWKCDPTYQYNLCDWCEIYPESEEREIVNFKRYVIQCTIPNTTNLDKEHTGVLTVNPHLCKECTKDIRIDITPTLTEPIIASVFGLVEESTDKFKYALYYPLICFTEGSDCDDKALWNWKLDIEIPLLGTAFVAWHLIVVMVFMLMGVYAVMR